MGRYSLENSLQNMDTVLAVDLYIIGEMVTKEADIEEYYITLNPKP